MQSTIGNCTPFGVTAYSRAVAHVGLDRGEESAVIVAARSGDQGARDRLIENCMQVALRRATSLAIFYRALRAVLRLDKALAAPNPVGYLRRAIEGAMLTYCRERQSAVRVPASMQSRKGIKPFDVLSLDAPYGDGGFTLADLIPS